MNFPKRTKPNPKIQRLYQGAMEAAQRNDLKNAEEYFRNILKQDPTQAEAYYGWSELAMKAGNFSFADKLLREALKLDPTNFKYTTNFSINLSKQGKFSEALPVAQRAVTLNPQSAVAHYNLALSYSDLGLVEHTIPCYEKAITLDPSFVNAYKNLGNAYRALGKFSQAETLFRRGLAASKGISPELWEALIYILPSSHDFKEDIEAIKKVLANTSPAHSQIFYLYFALAKAYENSRDYENAFKYYTLGNHRLKQKKPFNRAYCTHFVPNEIALFNADFMKERNHWGNPSEMPVFVVGMPRSGTTLVEQILASHPDVHGGGELKLAQVYYEQLNAINIQTLSTKAERFHALSAEQIRATSDAYLHEFQALAPNKKRIIDKMPFNFFNIGFLSLLFPNARFIHCTRNPLDIAVSNYAVRFVEDAEFTHDFDDFAFYYAHYEKIMNHWQQLIPDKIFYLSYEKLIENSTLVSRQLIQWLGLEWDEACLRYYHTERAVKTASTWQVRQPIYNNSVARWKHYEPYLTPLKEAFKKYHIAVEI